MGTRRGLGIAKARPPQEVSTLPVRGDGHPTPLQQRTATSDEPTLRLSRQRANERDAATAPPHLCRHHGHFPLIFVYPASYLHPLAPFTPFLLFFCTSLVLILYTFCSGIIFCFLEKK